jgi:phenylpyruvate tautomerase PptA (4-oxalocrotonate tautomerase family)
MPYLRVHSLELPREIKRTLVTELTQTVVETRHLRGAERDFCTIHFTAFAPEDLAIGGKLIANGRVPDYQIEYRDHDLSRSDKKKLARRITETMGRVLDLQGADLMRVNVLFVEYDTNDFAVGGTMLHDMWKRGVGSVLGRVSRVMRRARRRGAATASAATPTPTPERTTTAPPPLPS